MGSKINFPCEGCSLFLSLSKIFKEMVNFMLDIFLIRKYPLRGYFLGVLTHTTAWDRLWGGDVFLRLHIHSSRRLAWQQSDRIFGPLIMWF